MEIRVKNLGALKQATFELGDLTIICGGNNTGKTYATYALFGFLYTWRKMLSIKIVDQTLDDLLNEGVIHIDLSNYVERADKILAQGCEVYTRHLPEIFSANPNNFRESNFHVSLLAEQPIKITAPFERKVRAANAELFSLVKAEGDVKLIVSLLGAKEKLPKEVIKDIITNTILEIIFNQFFPNPFIASAERTGAAIFRKELNFARNRLLEEISQTDKDINPMKLFLKNYQDYALPVERNVEFTRQLESVAKKNSFLIEQHPKILREFTDIIGGKYNVTRNDELYFLPKGKRIKLTMDESSSAVRSLLDIGFYLHHIAKQGDLLIIDEPELNLHPKNQRRIARLFARLVNIGIKVFITTHSDYIIKEINTLIMLNQDKPYLKAIAKQEGYQPEEFIDVNRIKVYIAEEALVKLANNKKKSRCQTLTPAKISPDLGIKVPSFDDTINEMNRIQENIVWGGDD